MIEGGNKRRFELSKFTSFQELRDKTVKELPTSDLCLNDEHGIYQFTYIEDEAKKEEVQVKPGIYSLSKTSSGIQLIPQELELGNVLESIDNTKGIKKEAAIFFKNLHIYEEYNLPKKRAALLYGVPGTGKSYSIKKTAKDFVTEDPKFAVLIWPTSEIAPESVSTFLSDSAAYVGVDKLILIMEDIGGSEEDGSSRPREVTSGMLNMLDGVNVVFKVPTFIIATTNHPERLKDSLMNRPGRFDFALELPPPPIEQKIQLMEFISKKTLTDEEKDAFSLPGAEALSIAHLKEIFIRSRLHEKSITEVVIELLDHTKKFNLGFAKEKRMGMGLFSED